MSVSVQQLEKWLEEKDGERLEFKSARSRYDFEELTKYCEKLSARTTSGRHQCQD